MLFEERSVPLPIAPRPMPPPTLATILEEASVVAVVGCSARPSRTSHKIAGYLQGAGYRVVPVNPNYDEVLDETCYPSLADVPDDVVIDVVNVFRAPAYAADAVRDAAARAEATGTRPAVWTQLGVSTPAAKRLAQEAGLPYVQNRCIMVEHSRLA